MAAVVPFVCNIIDLAVLIPTNFSRIKERPVDKMLAVCPLAPMEDSKSLP